MTVVDVAGERELGTFPFDPDWPDERIYFSPDGARFSIVEPGWVVTRALPSGQVVDSAPAPDRSPPHAPCSGSWTTSS